MLDSRRMPVAQVDQATICAVIVTYFPSEDLGVVVSAIRDQVGHIIIVDNGSTGPSSELLNSLESEFVTIVRSKENLGIATALNLGVQRARQWGASWILTLDQDTICAPDMIERMAQAYMNDSDFSSIAVLAPVHFDRDSGYVSKELREIPVPVIERGIVMTSGNLIPIQIYDRIGQYDDDLFIEYVDTEFCLRVWKEGFRVLLVRDARIGHRLGEMRRHKLWPFRKFFSHNYLPVRRYYRARNRVILYRRYFSRWIFHDQNFAIRDFAKILLVETERWEKFKATLMGTLDALLGRLGRAEGAQHSTPKAPRYFLETRDEILPLLPKFSERAMDLGCGSGASSGKSKREGRFGWVCGVEGNPDVAKIAETRLDKVLVGDIEKMDFPFPEAYFDTILALDILEHLVDPWAALARIRRLLKPGGTLVISIPNVRHYSVTMPLLLFGDFRYQQEGILDATHLRFFTLKTIIRTLETAGFRIDKLDYTGAKYGLGGKANKLTLGLFKEFFIFQNLIACKRP